MRTVLVCGGRDFSDYEFLASVLDETHAETTIDLLIQGGARGADRLGRLWAVNHGIVVREFRAEWNRYRKGAGPVRNQQMLDEGRPTDVVAFADRHIEYSTGTRDMVTRARDSNLPCVLWEPIDSTPVGIPGPFDRSLSNRDSLVLRSGYRGTHWRGRPEQPLV